MLTERPADTSSGDPPIDSDSACDVTQLALPFFLSVRSCAALSPFQPGKLTCWPAAGVVLHDCTTQQASRSAFPAGESGDLRTSPPGRVLCSVAERYAAAVLRCAPKTSFAMAVGSARD